MDQLDSIKRMGLVPNEVHKVRKNYKNLEFYRRDDRIFFLTQEKDCLDYVMRRNYPTFTSPSDSERPKMIALRFRSELLTTVKLYHDSGYKENEPSIFRDRDWKAYSFSANCKIPPSELEECDYARKVFYSYKALSWIPLSQAMTYTQLYKSR